MVNVGAFAYTSALYNMLVHVGKVKADSDAALDPWFELFAHAI